MSANLLDGATVTRGTKDSDGYWVLSQNDGTDKKDSPMWLIDGQPTLTENQTVHMAFSVMPDEDWASNACFMSIQYTDAAGHFNWAIRNMGAAKAGVWTRLETSSIVQSGMQIVRALVSNAYTHAAGAKVTGVTISYGSPVCLASSAHTPYATQDHVSTVYATKASLKVTDDSITAEVEERGKLAGRVGTLESTTGTYTSRFEQLATSIRSLVKGESTYTDPDGSSATSGIYSLVTQTRDAVTALFGDYTKTSDLATTDAVKDAKKAGTDAQAAASAAQSTADSASSTAGAAKSTADSLATMIREDADGVTVGKSADGKTYSTTHTRMGAAAFEVLTKAGEVASSFGENLIELGKNSTEATIKFCGGLASIAAKTVTWHDNSTHLVTDIHSQYGAGLSCDTSGTEAGEPFKAYMGVQTSTGWTDDTYGVCKMAGGTLLLTDPSMTDTDKTVGFPMKTLITVLAAAAGVPPSSKMIPVLYYTSKPSEDDLPVKPCLVAVKGGALYLYE